ncbi:DUF669 domain-containing protein [Lactobacillus mellis]|nr:DUF669 domain-containing protein [Bombilactobacillus mellis]
MSLRDMATKTLQNFDAEKDSPNTPQTLPTGKYLVTLDNVEHRATDSGWEGLSIAVTVADGKYVGRRDFNSFNFETTSKNGKPIPESVIAGHIKLIAKLANACGIELQDDDWEDEDSISEAFMPVHGVQVLMDLSVKENKKNPQYPYKNYDFEKTEQPEEVEVKDSDLPFGEDDKKDPFADNAQSTDNDMPF